MLHYKLLIELAQCTISFPGTNTQTFYVNLLTVCYPTVFAYKRITSLDATRKIPVPTAFSKGNLRNSTSENNFLKDKRRKARYRTIR